jgi:transposase
MARWRQVVELAMSDDEIGRLAAIARSRSEAARRVERAQILLSYRENPSFFAVGQRLGVHHQTVQRCVERALAYGPLAALDDRPRPGKEPTITPEAQAWLVSLACDKAKEHGYPHELWTTRLLARHAREHAPAAGHESLANLVQGTVCKILGQEDIKPHKVRYYLERRDAEFERKMAEILCVYLDAAYSADTAIKLTLDNHSAHISKETKAWLADQPEGRFEFTFTPTHGSWLNLIEGFFSKLARSVLRHIRVASKQELKERIMAAIEHFNRNPVVHAWSYKLDKAA